MKTWKTKNNGYLLTRLLAGRSNVFLLAGRGKFILVDTSPGRRWKTLDRRLRRLGIVRLEALILTHAHFDHVGNAARIREKYRARVYVHREEAAFLAKGESVPVAGTVRTTRFLVDRLTARGNRLASFEPCPPDVPVAGTLRLDDLGFEACLLPTPGHSPGSMSLIVDDEIAVVGDAMFGVFPGSIFPPFGADPAQMVESWGRLLATSCRLFLSAHGSADPRRLVFREYRKRGGRPIRKPD